MVYARVGRCTVWLWVFAVVWSTLARAEAIPTAVTSDGVVEGLEERGIAGFLTPNLLLAPCAGSHRVLHLLTWNLCKRTPTGRVACNVLRVIVRPP